VGCQAFAVLTERRPRTKEQNITPIVLDTGNLFFMVCPPFLDYQTFLIQCLHLFYHPS
jgi:hypothetical protein